MQVHPGDGITAKVTDITPQRATTAQIYGHYMLGNDVELQYGVVGGTTSPSPTTTKVYLHRDPNGTVLLTGLRPSTSYGVRARQYDIPTVIASTGDHGYT